MPTTRTHPLKMRVSEQSLAMFEEMRQEAGLSQPRMFARLMAEQAQRRRLEHDLEILRRDQLIKDAAAIAGWQSTHQPDLGE